MPMSAGVVEDYFTMPGKAERKDGLDLGNSQPGMEINHVLTHKQLRWAQ